VSKLNYDSEAIRHRVQDWGQAHGVDVAERLIETLVDRFEVIQATVVEAHAENDTLFVKLSAPSWGHQQELAVLPTGGVAW
jgi:hypothetical protein